MISTLFLVRHGENEASRQGLLAGDLPSSLTERGRAQARRASERLSQLLAAVPGTVPVFSSPLPRTLETAWPIAEALGVAPEPDSAFTEFPLGPWGGRSFAELREDPAYLAYVQDPTKNPMGSGAFVRDVADRVTAGAARLLSLQRGPLLVLVTHGGVIRLLIAEALGMGLRHYNRIQCDEGSISALRYREDATDPTWPRLAFLNEKP